MQYRSVAKLIDSHNVVLKKGRHFWNFYRSGLVSILCAMEIENIVANTVYIKARESKSSKCFMNLILILSYFQVEVEKIAVEAKSGVNICNFHTYLNVFNCKMKLVRTANI